MSYCLMFRKKSWGGPNFIDLRFALEDDFQNSTDYSIGAAFTVTGLTEAGGAEWRNELEYGTEKRLATEIYLPLSRIRSGLACCRLSTGLPIRTLLFRGG